MHSIARFLAPALLVSCFSIPLYAFGEPKAVEGIIAKPTEIKRTVKLIGTVKAKKHAHVTSSIPGILQSLDVKGGVHVKKGTLLAHLKNDELRQSYELAKSNAAIAKQKLERVRKLYASQDVSKEALEDAQGRLSQENINVARAKTALENSEFRAPFDGTCGVFRVSEGSFVKTGEEIVTVFDPRELVLEFSVPQKLISKIEVGSAVTVFQQPGKVVTVQTAIDPNTYMGLALASVGECKSCVIGSHTDVHIVVEKHASAIGVPDDALFLRDGVQHVYVVRNNKAVAVAVELGIKGDALVEITKGIAAGDVVVTRGRAKLFDGADVKVQL
jgi:membrane fusion protein (multidrug efflux system)